MYTLLTERPVEDDDILRTIAEFSHPGIAAAVPRYFHSSSSSFGRSGWSAAPGDPQLDVPRAAPGGQRSEGSPRSFTPTRRFSSRYRPGARCTFLESRHFWPAEAPDEMRRVPREFVPA